MNLEKLAPVLDFRQRLSSVVRVGQGPPGRGVRAGVGGPGHCRNSGEVLAPTWEGCARLKGENVQRLIREARGEQLVPGDLSTKWR